MKEDMETGKKEGGEQADHKETGVTDQPAKDKHKPS